MISYKTTFVVGHYVGHSFTMVEMMHYSNKINLKQGASFKC